MNAFGRTALRVSFKLFLNLVVPFAFAFVLGALLSFTLPQCLTLGLTLVLAAYSICSGLDWPTFESLGVPLLGIFILVVLAILWWYAFVHGEQPRLLSDVVVLFPAMPYGVETIVDLFFGRD